MVTPLVQGDYRQQQLPYQVSIIASKNIFIGLKKNEPELREKLDRWIMTNLKNGKLNAIYEKYHGEPIPAEIVNPTGLLTVKILKLNIISHPFVQSFSKIKPPAKIVG